MGAGGCPAVVAQWRSHGASSRSCPGFDSRQLLAFSENRLFQHEARCSEQVHGHFAFLCVQFLFHYVLLALNCTYLGALQYLLGYVSSAKQVRTDPRATNHDMQQSIHYSYIQSRKPAVTGCSSGASPVDGDGDTDQLFGASRPRTMHYMCSYTCTEGFEL